MMKTTTLYQHGTLALLVPGLLTGTLPMSTLLAHGDTGIGTGEGLDGELIILDGKPYQVNSAGQVTVVGDDFTLPFANSHFADYRPLVTVENATREELHDQVLALTHGANTFFSIMVTGTFTDVKTRAVAKSSRPFKSLAETAENQSIFTRDTVKGTLLGYYSPQIFDGVAVGGYHDHFLDDDHTFGGHLLGCGRVTGEVQIQIFDTLEQHLPVADPDYQQHDFSQDDIMGDLHQAEG
ncbi:acetolactate decarboxylase [Levilactobacillus huananensis]|uniref:acetolactate decarboxylase n=1 Tax=Levilactobacillus huananensis TaxID=2486019 RepID=UPI000F77D416|nr:acetolactate decarboxylase [Levilactobacillus huananensis]